MRRNGDGKGRKLDGKGMKEETREGRGMVIEYEMGRKMDGSVEMVEGRGRR